MGGDVNPFGAAFGDQPGHGAHQLGVTPTRSGDEVGMLTHRLVHRRPVDRQRADRQRQPGQGDHRRRGTASVDPGVAHATGGLGDVDIDHLLHGMLELEVAVDLPAVGHGRRQHRGVLAAAVLQQWCCPPAGAEHVRRDGGRQRQRRRVAEGGLVEARRGPGSAGRPRGGSAHRCDWLRRPPVRRARPQSRHRPSPGPAAA